MSKNNKKLNVSRYILHLTFFYFGLFVLPACSKVDLPEVPARPSIMDLLQNLKENEKSINKNEIKIINFSRKDNYYKNEKK